MVVLDVTPKIGETFGSALARGLSAAGGYVPGKANYKFKGDLQNLQLYRNGVPISPVVGGRTPQRALVDNAWVTLKDFAYRGLYVYLPEAFAPSYDGTPPSIVLQIKDLKHPDDCNLFELHPALVARVWNDFGPYHLSHGAPHATADPRRFHSTFSKVLQGKRNCARV